MPVPGSCSPDSVLRTCHGFPETQRTKRCWSDEVKATCENRLGRVAAQLGRKARGLRLSLAKTRSRVSATEGWLDR